MLEDTQGSPSQSVRCESRGPGEVKEELSGRRVDSEAVVHRTVPGDSGRQGDSTGGEASGSPGRLGTYCTGTDERGPGGDTCVPIDRSDVLVHVCSYVRAKLVVYVTYNIAEYRATECSRTNHREGLLRERFALESFSEAGDTRRGSGGCQTGT